MFPLLLIVPVPQFPSIGFILVIKLLYNVFVHVTTVPYVNVDVVNVGCVSVIVNVALAVLVFHCASLTVKFCTLLVHHDFTFAAVTLNVALHHVHPPKLVVLKLYALLAVIHAHHTSVALALQLFAVHSAVLASSNVIVGHDTS